MRRSTVGGLFAALALAITATAAAVWLSPDPDEEITVSAMSWEFAGDSVVLVDAETGDVVAEYETRTDPDDPRQELLVDSATGEIVDSTAQDPIDIMAPLRRD